MADLFLHHVSIDSKDLERSIAFYQQLFGLARVERPPFPVAGAWLTAGPSLQIHIVDYAEGHFRSRGIDVNDGHFAFRTADFDAFVERAEAMGFKADAADDDPMRMVLRRKGIAGFDQVYLLDPDRNQIEVNGAS